MPLPLPAQRILWLCAVVCLIVVQIAVPVPRHSRFWSAVFDTGHVPLYGLVALAILRWRRSLCGRPGGPRLRFYLQALALTIAAGVAAELIQAPGPGDTSAGDVARDALGATAFLLVALAFDREPIHGRTRVPRETALLLAVLLLALALVPLAATSIAYLGRNAAFPRICGFDAAWERKFVSAHEADLERTPAPEGWGRKPSDRVGRVVFRPGMYPGLRIGEPHPDWRGFERLVFDVYSELPEPVALDLRIDDHRHNEDYWDRFNRTLILQPGASCISIPLRNVQTAPRGREMDMSHVRGLALFANHPGEAFVIYFDEFRLE
jgi:hypothetical protein